jgi:hypothetical protein
MTEREIWFRRDRSDRMINLPVHWKGWVAVGILEAVVLSAVAFLAYAEAYLPPQEREVATIGGWLVMALAFVAFIVVSIRHKGDPDRK